MLNLRIVCIKLIQEKLSDLYFIIKNNIYLYRKFSEYDKYTAPPLEAPMSTAAVLPLTEEFI